MKTSKPPRMSTAWESMDPIKSGLRKAERSHGVRRVDETNPDMAAARAAFAQRRRNLGDVPDRDFRFTPCTPKTDTPAAPAYEWMWTPPTDFRATTTLIADVQELHRVYLDPDRPAGESRVAYSRWRAAYNWTATELLARGIADPSAVLTYRWEHDI